MGLFTQFLGIKELEAFLVEMWESHRAWSTAILHALNEKGACIKYHAKTDYMVSPEDVVIYWSPCLTQELIEQVREQWAADQELVLEPAERDALDQDRAEVLKGKDMNKDELTQEWSRLNILAKESGFPGNYIQDLFARVCKSLGEKEPTLTEATLKALRENLEAEIQLNNLERASETQEEPAKKPEDVKEPVSQSEENPKQESPSVEQSIKESGSLDALTKSSNTGADSVSNAAQSSTPEKPGKKKKADPETAQIKSSTLEDLKITNGTTGEVLTFNDVMRRWFVLQIKKATIEVEKQMYVDQCTSRLNEVKTQEQGWEFLYKSEVTRLVKEQFAKQKKETGEYKPATVKTEYCTFKRNPEDSVKLTDEQKFLEWADTVSEEEMPFWGGIFEPTIKLNKKAAAELLESGQIEELPGFTVVKEPDSVGEPKLSLSKPRNQKTETENTGGIVSEPVENSKSEETAA